MHEQQIVRVRQVKRLSILSASRAGYYLINQEFTKKKLVLYVTTSYVFPHKGTKRARRGKITDMIRSR
jgi:hypothetical protein